MTQDEIRTTRYDAATAERWHGRSFVVAPSGWRDAARTIAGDMLAGDEPAEVRVCPAALHGLSASAMVAASALRDAGIGLALTDAARPEDLGWLRMLPWSAVIVHPALLRQAAAPDGARVVESWADAACRRGLQFVAAVGDTGELPFLRAAGFTHAEVSHAGL